MLFSRKRPEGLTRDLVRARHLHGRRRPRRRARSCYTEHYREAGRSPDQDATLAAPARGSRRASTTSTGNFSPLRPGNQLQLEHQRRRSAAAATTYQTLMTTNDGAGQMRAAILASEALFGGDEGPRDSKNLVVPLVGDFAGPKAIRSVGQYLKDKEPGATVGGVLPVERRAVPRPERRLADVLQQRREPAAERPAARFIYSQGGAAGGGSAAAVSGRFTGRSCRKSKPPAARRNVRRRR